jgi:hypothetical protein
LLLGGKKNCNKNKNDAHSIATSCRPFATFALVASYVPLEPLSRVQSFVVSIYFFLILGP